MKVHRSQPAPRDVQAIITLLQGELAATNREVMLLTLELEERVAERTAQLVQTNQDLVREIAERKHAEEEVRKLNEDLKQRAGQLEAANEELEAFAYSVSHDLRAPLRHIQGFAEILREEAGPALGQAGTHLDRICASAQNMSVLIDELLHFSRLSRAELKASLIDLD